MSVRRSASSEAPDAAPRSKICQACGRTFAWRRKWARDWEEVRYCSRACRGARPNDQLRRLEDSILNLLGERKANASICPSEAARAMSPEDWRTLMPDVRKAAQRLWARGAVEITQRGKRVDPSRAKGPIRIRLASGNAAECAQSS